jgi:hypothetical protein
MNIKKILFSIILILGFNTSSNSQVPSYLPKNGLLSWWPFSGNANDGSGNGCNGIVNEATLTTDRFGNINSAYSFNGTSSYIEANVKNYPLKGEARTISGWYKANNPILSKEYDFCLLNYGNISDPINWFKISFYRKGYLDIQFNSNIYSSQENYFNGNWTFFTFVFDDTNNTYSLYINNVYKLGGSGYLYTNGIDNLFRIGRNKLNNYFEGSIDDIGIWNRALTPQEISALYNSSLGVNDFKQNTTISIYPNPTTNVLNFKSNANMINSDYTIYDQSGKIMKIGKITHENTSIQLNNLPNGIYLLNVENIKQTFKVLKE